MVKEDDIQGLDLLAHLSMDNDAKSTKSFRTFSSGSSKTRDSVQVNEINLADDDDISIPGGWTSNDPFERVLKPATPTSPVSFSGSRSSQSILSPAIDKAARPISHIQDGFSRSTDTLRSDFQSSDKSEIGPGGRLVIAIDYGTTYTGVAVVAVTGDVKQSKLKDIRVIVDWGKKMNNEKKVPSAYSYSQTEGDEEQWGKSFSPNAITMVHTKLELDEQENKMDELETIMNHLDGMHDLEFAHVERNNGEPEYSPKKPEDIAKDYLVRIFQKVEKFIDVEYIGMKKNNPVDIVFTTPVSWSYAAKNATYRAITAAGFNSKTFPKLRDTLMITEPEAAAVYTARYLREEKPGSISLKKDDGFILADCGGGTCDVVTFRIAELDNKTLELVKVGDGKGAKCGSIFIDSEFKTWLRDNALGIEAYQVLDPNGVKRIKHGSAGENLRDVMAQFTTIKQKFGREDDDGVYQIELPREMHSMDLDDQFVVEGLLTMIEEEIELFFDLPVEKILEMIIEQTEQAEVLDIGSRIRNIFMIGGFGESKYLQKKLRSALEHLDIEVYQPDTSWEAVVRGAAMHGIEKGKLKNCIKTNQCPYYFAVAEDQEVLTGSDISLKNGEQKIDKVLGKTLAVGQLRWIVQRGDLVLHSPSERPETLLGFQFTRHGPRKFNIPIYQYLGADDKPPSRIRGSEREISKVMEIEFNFDNQKLDDFDPYEGPNGIYYQAAVSLKLAWVDNKLMGEVIWNDQTLFSNYTAPNTT